MRLFPQNRLLIDLMKFWQRVKFQPTMVSAAKQWQQARVVLICFPEEYEARQVAEEAVRAIVEACPRKRFCILTTKALPQRWLNVELVRLRGNDLNLFSLPSGEFIRYIQYKRIQVAIDLWPSFNLTNAWVCRRSGARLRMSFDNEHAPAFFNLLVVTQGREVRLSRQYEAMVEMILNLERSGTEHEG
jgi:hypothetical protein